MRCCCGVPEGTASLYPSTARFPLQRVTVEYRPVARAEFTAYLVDVSGIARIQLLHRFRLNLPNGFQPVATSIASVINITTEVRTRKGRLWKKGAHGIEGLCSFLIALLRREHACSEISSIFIVARHKFGNLVGLVERDQAVLAVVLRCDFHQLQVFLRGTGADDESGLFTQSEFRISRARMAGAGNARRRKNLQADVMPQTFDDAIACIGNFGFELDCYIPEGLRVSIPRFVSKAALRESRLAVFQREPHRLLVHALALDFGIAQNHRHVIAIVLMEFRL
jgi:hypothetical protein